MFNLFDSLSVVFWSIAYIIMIVNGFRFYKEQKRFFVLISGAPTLAWELLALIRNKGFWGHILWFLFDFFVFFQNFYFIKSRKKRIAYLLFLGACIAILYWIFTFTNGMLIASFVIDFLISLEFIITAKRISPRWRVEIGISRLIGDVSALIGYAQYSAFIAVIGSLILLMNTSYVCYCIYLRRKENKEMLQNTES